MHEKRASRRAGEGRKAEGNYYYVRCCLSMVETWPPSPRETRQYLYAKKGCENTSGNQHEGSPEGQSLERDVDAPVDSTGTAERFEEAFVVRDDDELELQGAKFPLSANRLFQLLSCVFS